MNSTGKYDPVIPKDQLVHGQYYRGRCRNASVARWDADLNMFLHWRQKFGHWFIETIHCPEDENKWDVFIAEEPIDAQRVEKPIHFPHDGPDV